MRHHLNWILWVDKLKEIRVKPLAVLKKIFKIFSYNGVKHVWLGRNFVKKPKKNLCANWKVKESEIYEFFFASDLSQTVKGEMLHDN